MGDNKGVGFGLGVVKWMVDLFLLCMDVILMFGKGSCFSIEVLYGES